VKRKPTEGEVLDHFWSYVDKNGPLPDPSTGVKSRCWLWLGSVTDQGYGRYKIGEKSYQVSRFAWKCKGKPDPGELTISTRCLNKLCVRHQYTRSRAEILSSIAPLRRSGEDSHLARLTSKQVILMRKLYGKGGITQAELARRFGISTGHVKRILARRSWKHLAIDV
jgi:Sigma-70, region 4